MIRKVALQMAIPALLVLMAFNAYLAISHLKKIQKGEALSLESSRVQGDIAAVGQDLTEMESGQRGYVLTEDTAYLQPYTAAKGRIGNDFAMLRSGLADRAENERSLEAQLEALANSKQAEMERTISLRERGYRLRAFQMVATNEGREYMEKARGLLSSLSSMEKSRFAEVESAMNSALSEALRTTVLANLWLLAFTVFLFAYVRYYGRKLEQEAAESRRALVGRDAELGRLKSVLSNQARTEIAVVEDNARMLVEKYEGFLPRQGCEYAALIKDAAAQIERLRKDLLAEPQDSNIEVKAA
jgi:CHASE3 domain sensor protein